MKDQISQQPDEILVQILSLLTIQEAGRTSVVSRRWKDLWKFTTSIVFESPDSLCDERREHLVPLERSKFVTRVNQVLTLHESPSLDKVSVQFSLDRSFSREINEWIKFIIRKRVKVLKIDLVMNYKINCLGEYYGFSQECCGWFKSVSNLSSLQCLTSLSLSGVNVDGELIEYFLSNCPHLEKLFISHSKKLLKLKVAGASVQLKSLVIAWCHKWKSIELSAPKLVTFNCCGCSLLSEFHIGSNPLLSELIVTGGYSVEVTSSFLPPFSNILPQLETLSLSMWFDKSKQVIPQIPVLRNLKHLILEFKISAADISLISFTKLIMEAPCFVKFTLKLALHGKRSKIDDMRRKHCSQQPHEYLREVEITGFDGRLCDFELAMFLLRSAINMEKMVIRPSRRCGLEEDGIRRLQRRVDVLKRMLPPGAELILLEYN